MARCCRGSHLRRRIASTLAPLERYASLQLPDGTRRIVGATDATRGCKHRCRHCPIVPVYDGQFRVVPVDVVLADIEQQILQGAEHITFGDPDFFNGPTHARRIVEALHERHPDVSYDVTIKVEHLLRERRLLPVLAQTGCAFVTSAVEAVDDAILDKLEKGHTRQDFIAAVVSAARRDWRWRRRSSRSRRGRRGRAIATCWRRWIARSRRARRARAVGVAAPRDLRLATAGAR